MLVVPHHGHAMLVNGEAWMCDASWIILGLQTSNLEAYLFGDKFNNLVLESYTLSICFQLGLLTKTSNLLNSSWLEKPLSMAHIKNLFKSEFNFIPNMT